MGTRLSSSTLYAHLWGTPELTAVFDERAMLQTWLDVLAALARAQASLGIVPDSAAAALSDVGIGALDLGYVAEQTRATSHSTLGLIRGLLRVLPEHAREHVYVGATVQDVTDTWFGIVMRDVGAIVRRDLLAVEERLLELAREHRGTVMAGRTHGQPGAPITFGFKVASWADEVRRHLDRLREGAPRWSVGQLGGAVGALAFFGADGPELRARFCAELGLGDPGISWLTARDRVAEFGGVLAGVCGTLARIGTEVYELARPEIGELAEAAPPGAVSSITMPHKRNPEGSEHLDTLARLARSSAAVLLEGMVGGHERDGRSWKAEWIALPEVCQLTGTATSLALRLLDGLEVNTAAMAANAQRYGGGLTSERVLAGLSGVLGKHRAQQVLHEVLRESGEDLVAGLVARGVADEAQVRAWATGPAVDAAAGMVDGVLARSCAETVAPATAPAHDRFPLGVFPTPLHRARRLETALGCGPVWVKRDDLAGFGVAGNKTRPLEFLVAAALAEGADVLVTGGGAGSNFAPAAALAARVAGLDCELLVAGAPGGALAPNLALAVASGAVLRYTGADRSRLDRDVADRAAELRAAGRRPYAVPRGGSTGLGAVGFAAAAAELLAELTPALVVLSVGSGGSIAGLTAGFAAAGVDVPVLGVSVSRPPPDIAAHVAGLAADCAALLGGPVPAAPEWVDARGAGFGVASARDRDAARLALHTEGLLLDDSYGAKAFSALLDRLPAAGPVVYWHTGGVLPALTHLPASPDVEAPQ
ncbi:pyridoxal-phosphate dependent enzyme [Pseudonocardia abyssalis]|uniref:Pyridoxal-phosphate dependent enzyme n=1 Tax=Pseudonocardia abyssalis TaxID=2792008 RepID=A0ABS6UR96_9PSEU|nr:pyridoxal-phosphate dependent enzyme [Pseudonocardia abyssalis]MBW0134456.1 pyridoxal-phosphate dependent enzyme [Pseudonocardia abyssalis]